MSNTKSALFLMGIVLIANLMACEFSFKHNSADVTSIEKDDYRVDEMSIQHGMEVFNQFCASCHNFSENLIGPNLAGITSEVSKDWLSQFITNSPAMIEGGDERSLQLFEKYKQYMPAFPNLVEQDIEDILGFIHKFSQAEKRNINKRKGGLINPIPEKIETSELTLVLEEQFKITPSSTVAPISRINQMNAIPGGRVFIHDLRGKLHEIGEGNEITTYIDLSEQLADFIDNPGKATGFGSWAFHPDFETNGLFYTTHNEAPETAVADFPLPDSIDVTVQAIILEWQAENPAASTFNGSYRELMRVDMLTGAHTFQHLTFNPLAQKNDSDYGMLYLGIGDGYLALRGHSDLCDNYRNIWSTVIRIDPLKRNSKNGQYGIPVDNPFVNYQEATKEIWAMGFRNPHRITWDETGTGKMIITNIGQHSVEEVNVGIAGANYGWPNREGSFLFDVDANIELVYPLPSKKDKYTYPVAQYDHDEGSAVSGGFVYAGSKIPQLYGKYIFGDMSRGWMYYSEVQEMNNGSQAQVYRLNVSFEGELSDMSTITGHNRVDLRIGIDAQKELYLFSKGNGAVYKIVECKSIDTFDLSD